MLPQLLKFKHLQTSFLILVSSILFSQTTINSYDFESGLSGWTSYKDGYLNTDSQFSCNGSQNSIAVEKAGIMTSPAQNLVGYKFVDFSFSYKTYGLSGSWDGFDVEFFNGSSWVLLKSFEFTVDFDNTGAGYEYNYTLRLNRDIGFTTNSKFRFADTSGSSIQTSYFDDVLIEEGADKVDFDGVDDYIRYGDINDLTGSFSIEAWVMQEQIVNELGTIVAKRYDRGAEQAENARGYQFALKDGYPRFSWYKHAGSSEFEVLSPYILATNKWYHVAVTYKGGTLRLYIDGIEVDAITTDETMVDNDQNFTIGALFRIPNDPDPKFYFDGSIQEVRVWDVQLTEQQIREMMNQHIEENTAVSPNTTVKGITVPLDVSGGLLWENLIGYYPLNDTTGDDYAANPIDGLQYNITTEQVVTAPLPYITTRGGDWDDDVNTTSPWTYVDNWNIPNTTGIDGYTVMDWNIVETKHNVTTNRNVKVLGLNTEENELSVLPDNSLTITNYLKINGVLDLDGESQLLQDTGSVLEENSTGYLERDQQGTASSYNYNYWSSPLTPQGSANNSTYTIAGVLRDGTNSSSPAVINFQPSAYAADNAAPSPIILSSYWMYRFKGPSDDYNSWIRVGSTGALKAGEGFTLKGADGTKSITDTQNYVFKGKPNNGTINLTLDAGKDYLIGNPYTSSIDAIEFINDNLKDTPGGTAATNVINGALYFWDHFATKTHLLKGYVGGYGTLNKIGGVKAVSTDTRIDANGAESTRRPGQYIPVTQGFFVIAYDGGTITFNNSQRIFKEEVAEVSTFLKSEQIKNTQKSTDKGLKIWLNFDLPSGYHRQLLIGEAENTNIDFDLGYDAPLIEYNDEDAYWYFDSDKYVIQGVPLIDNAQTFPIGIKVKQAGLFRVNLDDLMYDYNNIPIYLKDNTTDEVFDIKNGIFETVLEAGEYNNRFSIVFEEQVALSVDDGFVLQEEAINIYVNQEESMLTINKTNEVTINNVSVYNTLGQQIHSWNSNLDKNTIQLPVKLTKGVYIAILKTNNKQYSKKILIQN